MINNTDRHDFGEKEYTGTIERIFFGNVHQDVHSL